MGMFGRCSVLIFFLKNPHNPHSFVWASCAFLEQENVFENLQTTCQTQVYKEKESNKQMSKKKKKKTPQSFFFQENSLIDYVVLRQTDMDSSAT